ncbi:MAG: hypothetical protein H6509_10980 [Bryobacterales bacterium]|nr:hypothetical protein [Bryobacterales bacterium]
MVEYTIGNATEIAAILSSISELLTAISSFAWPVLTLIIILVFHDQIITITQRIKKGRVFGQELELAEDLDKLEDKAKIQSDSTVLATDASPPETAQETRLEDAIIQLAEHSPKLALMKLSAELERAALHLIASTGKLDEVLYAPFSEQLRLLERHGLPKTAVMSLRQFQDVRNRIVHGRSASHDDILRAVDSGLIILRSINSVPHERNVVEHPGVDIFSDEQGKDLIEDAKGVILTTTSAGGASESFRIFPTTRRYEKGQAVSWEWNLNRKWGKAWYRDPQSGELTRAWDGSLEFSAGRWIQSSA